ncbi:extracellular matrix protein 2-like [Gadus macrocephalus]|uniref:extracellular matrix protein 2-like n=1 Tax=Gadus macrocephalus TaxID=80720 RepID=UPI0028CB138F|nr:extracellular matrix protein 2-like [Gadus macrocephalus]
MTLAGFNSSLPEACQPTNGIISCRGMGLAYLPNISDLEVTQLDLSENNISHVAPAALSGLPRLETLDLGSNTLGDESLGPDALTNLTSLRRLILDGNQITRVPAVLPPSLVELKMNRNALNALEPHSFTGLGNLVSLELRDNSLDDSTVSPSAFEALESVQELYLDGNRLHSIPWGLPNTVQVLGLSNNLLEGVSTEALSGCMHLKKLDLSRNQLRDEAIASKAWIKLTALESLDLSFNHLGSIPENLPRSLLHLTIQHNTLRHIPGFSFRHLRPGLRTLRLSHNALGDKGVAHVSFVGAYRSLTELHLDDNGLTVVPLSIRQFKNLQALRLDGNHIRTVKRWALCPPRNAGSSLTSLHLENNLLRGDRLPPRAFSCLPDPQGLVLQPQRAPTPDLL